MSVWHLKAGETLPQKLEIGPISRSDIVRYQGASGDFQPVHHDEPFARAAGHQAPLVIGMYPAGVISLWAAQMFGPDTVRRVSVRWTAMVWPGDTLTGSGKIKSIAKGEHHIELNLANQAGLSVLRCDMTFVRTADK